MKNMLFIAAMATVFAGCGSQKNVQEHGETEAETTAAAVTLSPEQMKMAGIEIGKLQRRSLDALVHAVGNIEISAMQRTAVHATNEGYIKKINLQLGNRVQKGEVLAVLEHPSYITKQREMLETLAKLPYLQAEMERKKELQANDAGSLKNYQAAQADYRWAQSHYEGVKAELRVLGFDVDKIESTGQYQTQISVVSSASGVVTQLFANPGKLVQPDMMICEISDMSRPQVLLQVFAHQIPMLREGLAVDVRLTGSSKTYTAVIEQLIPQIDSERKTAQLRLSLKQSDNAMVAGAAVQADIHIPEQNTWALPKESIVQGAQNEVFAFSVVGNEVKLVPIQIKSESSDWAAVEADTSLQYVMKGGYYLRDKF